MDKTALRRLLHVGWDTTVRIIERVMADGLDPKRLDGLFVVGVDEVSWHKGHSYITLMSDRRRGKFVWGQEGKDAGRLDCFFDELGDKRSEAIEAMSMDMGPPMTLAVGGQELAVLISPNRSGKSLIDIASDSW